MMTLKSLPTKYQPLLIAAIGLLLIVGAYFVIWSPQLEEKNSLKSEASRLDDEHARLSAIQKNLPRARAELAELKVKLEDVLRQIPEEKEVPGLLRQVSSAAQESRTRIKYFAPKDLVAHDFYSELPFEIRYAGTYHGLGYFFDAVRNLERIVSVTNFTLEARGSEAGKQMLEGSCTAKTYVSVSGSPKKQGKGKNK